MDLRCTIKFGEGPKELSGSSDLVNQYKLLHHYEFFCKKSLPSSISETRYLHNVVGDSEIRKGKEEELAQLSLDGSHLRQDNASIQVFDLGVLMEAFRMRQSPNIMLPCAEKRVFMDKSKNECKLKKRKHKTRKYKDKEKGHNKKHKHHSNVFNNKEERSGIRSGLHAVKISHGKVLKPMFRT